MKYNPTKNPIEIKCKGNGVLTIEQLHKFQGDLKKLKPKNRDRLIASICEKGFIAPVFVWKNKDSYELLDGTQRTTTLLYMQEKGWAVQHCG